MTSFAAKGGAVVSGIHLMGKSGTVSSEAKNHEASGVIGSQVI